MARLISNGHSAAYEYGMSFYVVAMDQLAEQEIEHIKHTALAVKGSHAEDLTEFYAIFNAEQEDKAEEDHQSNMALLNKKL